MTGADGGDQRGPAQVLAGGAADLLGPIAYLDADGTIVPTDGSCKQGMDIAYNGIWGYPPLVVSLANTREVLYLVNRPGNAPSHAGRGRLDRQGDRPGRRRSAERVCLRGDTDFSLTAHFDRWAERVDFVFGMDNTAALRSPGRGAGRTAWQPAGPRRRSRSPTGTTRARREDRQAADRDRTRLPRTCGSTTRTSPSSTTGPASARRPYRLVALRKNISRSTGEQALIDDDPLLLLHHHPHRPDRRRRSWPAPTNAATRRTSSGSSRTA